MLLFPSNVRFYSSRSECFNRHAERDVPLAVTTMCLGHPNQIGDDEPIFFTVANPRDQKRLRKCQRRSGFPIFARLLRVLSSILPGFHRNPWRDLHEQGSVYGAETSRDIGLRFKTLATAPFPILFSPSLSSSADDDPVRNLGFSRLISRKAQPLASLALERHPRGGTVFTVDSHSLRGNEEEDF